MTKDILLDKVKNLNKGNFDVNQLKAWIRSLPSSTRIKPDKIKKGDVFMHPIFMHPYVFIEKKGDYWLCTLLTSNGEFEEVLEQCKGRFFGDSFITKVIFTMTEPIGSFVGVYDNNRHLGEISRKLKTLLI